VRGGTLGPVGLAAFACALSTTLVAGDAAADLEYRSEWRRFQPGEYVLTGALLASTGIIIAVGKTNEAAWTEPILLDEQARATFRASTPAGRRRAQIAGDVPYYVGLTYPYVVDAIALAWIKHGSRDVAGQMMLMDTEAFAISGFLSFLSNQLIRRERPYMRACRDPENPVFPGCYPEGSNEGFFSGHTAIAFTGATLTCWHASELGLYGTTQTASTIACATALTTATVGGFARLVADKHYLSDVLVGAAVGLAAGFLVPFFHYRSPTASGSSTTTAPSTTATAQTMFSGTF
jgi:membrane-associated phospholipid phosphatase